MTRIMNPVFFALLLSALFSATTHADTHTAASCSASDVQAAISAASAGDTVAVPAGTCTWSSLAVNKAVRLQGAGTGQTNITLNGNEIVVITKQPAGVIRIQGFSFSTTGGDSSNAPLLVTGSWQSAQPVIIQNNVFLTNGSGCSISYPQVG